MAPRLGFLLLVSAALFHLATSCKLAFNGNAACSEDNCAKTLGMHPLPWWLSFCFPPSFQFCDLSRCFPSVVLFSSRCLCPTVHVARAGNVDAADSPVPLGASIVATSTGGVNYRFFAVRA